MVFELHVVSQNKNTILLVREGMRVLVCQAALAPGSHEHTEPGVDPSLPPAEYSARSRAGRGLAWPHPVGSVLGKSAFRGSGRRVALGPTGPSLSAAEGGTSFRQTRTRAHTPAPGQRKQTQQGDLLHAPNRRAVRGAARMDATCRGSLSRARGPGLRAGVWGGRVTFQGGPFLG